MSPPGPGTQRQPKPARSVGSNARKLQINGMPPTPPPPPGAFSMPGPSGHARSLTEREKLASGTSLENGVYSMPGSSRSAGSNARKLQINGMPPTPPPPPGAFSMPGPSGHARSLAEREKLASGTSLENGVYSMPGSSRSAGSNARKLQINGMPPTPPPPPPPGAFSMPGKDGTLPSVDRKLQVTSRPPNSVSYSMPGSVRSAVRGFQGPADLINSNKPVVNIA